ncbi:MAG: hypothetical protein SGPRY_008092, partial [Prymnesium sp.]
RLAVAVALSLFARALFFLCGVGHHFAEDPLLGSPFSSAVALEEGWELWSRGISPYVTPLCRAPPLALVLLYLPSLVRLAGLLVIDGSIAWLLYSFGDTGSSRVPADSTKPVVHRGTLAALVYTLAPWTAVATASLDFGSIANFAALNALLQASKGHSVVSASCLAVASYLSPDLAWLFPMSMALHISATRWERRAAREAAAPTSSEHLSITRRGKHASGAGAPTAHSEGFNGGSAVSGVAPITRASGHYVDVSSPLLYMFWYCSSLCTLLTWSRLAMGSWSFVAAVYGRQTCLTTSCALHGDEISLCGIALFSVGHVLMGYTST